MSWYLAHICNWCEGGILRGLDVSPSGTVAVTGGIGSFSVTDTGFPEVNPIAGQSCVLDPFGVNWSSGFVAYFDAVGSLVFSSCLGGTIGSFSTEMLRSVDIASDGLLYVLGYSSMTDFPTVNPIQATNTAAPRRTNIVSVVDPTDSSLDFSTYFGPLTSQTPPNRESGAAYILFPYHIKRDSNGNIVIAGLTNALTFPTVNAFQPNLGVPESSLGFDQQGLGAGVTDVFVSSMHPTNGIVFSTFIGGNGEESGFQRLAFAGDDILVAAVTQSDDYPLLNELPSSQFSNPGLVLTRLTPEGALATSTFLGGTGYRGNLATSLAVNSTGKIVVASTFAGDDFPVVGNSTSSAGESDFTLSIIDASGDTDGDGDGVPDVADEFPGDSSEWVDTDGDLTGDNADADDDGDGTPDASDAFPKIASEQIDSDSDGAGDNLDEFDAIPTEYFDLDSDGTGDWADMDTDGDGTPSPDDQLDYDPSETLDTDRDLVGNNADPDDDGDGIPDIEDDYPLDSQAPVLNFGNYSASDNFTFPNGFPQHFSPTLNATNAWTSASDEFFSLGISMGSRIIGDNEVSAIQHSDNYIGGTVRFWYKVDSEPGLDVFSFWIDGNMVLSDSGNTGWKSFSTAIQTGPHTLEWRYAKDGANSVGADAAWIDNFENTDEIVFSSFE